MEKESTKRRYEIAKKIGSGDFALVYQARDTKLGRDVAIKQLHKQFLDDKQQLARYWQEAQLLVSLEHPNIMGIYDILRSKGCLVLELMQGSLQQIYGSKPMPVQDVRQTIIQTCQGLDCLHKNGIIHGDIKPGNLFLSRQEIVKLGDFGLARRAADSDGSLVKGTTRYMAPELVSEDFGDVGPASDLYSLGFSALELLVGPQFESLFPDLIAFGRDRQMAWMMWHCSADRRLPPVKSLLEGVPDDLANVLEKLTAKRQSERYQSAQQVLDDLSGDTAPVGQSLKDEEAAAAEQARRHKKKRRIQAAIAVICSICLGLGIYWFNLDPPPQPERTTPPPIRGVVRNVLPLDNKLVMDLGQDWKEFTLVAKDQVTLNRKQRQLRDLQLGDRVTVHTRLEPEGQYRLELVAFRPEKHSGVVTSVIPDPESFVMQVQDGSEEGAQFQLAAADDLAITINQNTEQDGQAFSIGSLQKNDRVRVNLSDDESGMLALRIDALRVVSLNGFIREIDTADRVITVDLGETGPESDQYVRIPVSAECQIKLNGNASLDQQVLRLSDLSPGDRVQLQHDVNVVSIDAFRVYRDQGTIVSLDYESRLLTIDSESASTTVEYLADDKCAIDLGGQNVSLSDLRSGDTVQTTHESPDLESPPLSTLSATRPADVNKWAILIANDAFADQRVPPFGTAIVNARRIKDSLNDRYAVPEDQTFLCHNFDGVRIRQEIPEWLANIPSGSELCVYLATRAFAEPGQNVFLSPQDVNPDELESSGLKLDWLLDHLDRCAAGQKVLFLDCTPPDSGQNPAQISAAEMLELVRKTRRGGYPRFTYVLGSCSEGQTAMLSPNDPNLGLFAEVIAEGLAGAADQARDNKIEVTELADYVEKQVSLRAASANASQRPVLILPDATPPRISNEARAAILALLSRFSEERIDVEQVAGQAQQAEQIAGRQPEPMLAFGLLLIKSAKMDQAREVLERVRLNFPKSILAHRAVIWLNFYKVRYDAGLIKMQAMMEHIPLPDELEEGYSAEQLDTFEWLGRLREIAAVADWTRRLPSKREIAQFDQTIERYGDQPGQRFAAGRQHVQSVLANIARELADDPSSQADLKKSRLRTYMGTIADDQAIANIRDGMEK